MADSQTAKRDWYQIVGDLLEISTDTAVSLEAVGISEVNAKKKFGPETDFEVATIDKAKVVHRRTEDKISYGGRAYERTLNGKRTVWVPSIR